MSPTLAPLIAERLIDFDADGAPILLGGRDRITGRLVFPLPADEDRFERIGLPNRGRLWSWTVQRFRPKSPPYAGPAEFAPYAVGYVALGEAIIVEGRLSGVAFEDLRIGLPLRLTTEPFAFENGEMRLTFAFAPEDRL
ncbi:Zn-ribbon domain-containing OB-fold protein [Caulobacter sp. LARHSG274]